MEEPVAIIGGMYAPPASPAPAVKFYREEGTVQRGEFAGWQYRIQTDRRGVRWTLYDGSVLVLIWPDEKETNLRPLPCRWIYIHLDQLEEA